MIDCLAINTWLKDTYGLTVWADVPRYRVSWTTTQPEKRLIKNRKVFSGPIFLREESGVFDVPKYPFAQDRWVLEKAIPVPDDYAIVGVNYTYEPLWVFQTNKGAYLPLERKAVKLVIFFHEAPELSHKSPDDFAREEAKIDAAEVAEFEAQLEDVMTPWSQIKDLVE
jgi:hypothetical protein